MAETTLDLDLDPKKVIASLSEVSKHAQELAKRIEDSLGKEVPKQIEKMEDATEKGTNRMSGFFRNLGTRVKDDLKAAFDATRILSGMKFTDELAEGVKQVFTMERAFDRLNVRLGLSIKNLGEFKSKVNQKVAATGADIGSVLPGVETFATKGQIKNPEQLANISEMLGKVNVTTGEDTHALSEHIVEILKRQKLDLTDKNVKATLDALQASRINGFGSITEAASAMEQTSGFAVNDYFKMSGREMAGLTSTASQAGDNGNQILNHILQKAATGPGQMDALNAIFGKEVFKNGKFDAEAMGQVDVKKFGAHSQATLEAATGAFGPDLNRFIEAFKKGSKSFKEVVNGANETATQYDKSSKNLATMIAQFKNQTKAAASDVGSGLSQSINSLLHGDLKGTGQGLLQAGGAVYENKGVLSGAVATTAAMSFLMGGGINSLLKKVPGGGILSKVAGAEVAEAVGVQKVYVVNAGEMGGGGGLGGASMAPGMIGKLGAYGAALGVGYAIGDKVKDIPIVSRTLDKVFGDDGKQEVADAKRKMQSNSVKYYNEKHHTNFDYKQMEEAIHNGFKKAMPKTAPPSTNKSAVTGRGGHS